MNYKKHYDLLIQKRLSNPLSKEEYGEWHHIVPRCMGGNNDKSNLVRLSAREHYVAHQLLFLEYRTSKLAHAWFNMIRKDPNQERIYTSRQHERAVKAHANALRKSMKGEGNHFYGRKHTQESKDAVGRANAGRKRKKEDVEWFVNNVAKAPRTKEWRKRISESTSGLVTIKSTETGKTVRVRKEELSNYDLNIWKNPAAVNQKRGKCVHCGKESVMGNIKRWHNENCKHKGSSI